MPVAALFPGSGFPFSLEHLAPQLLAAQLPPALQVMRKTRHFLLQKSSLDALGALFEHRWQPPA